VNIIWRDSESRDY